jgi:hypothetical protein
VKKAAIIILIFLGVIFGVWLARENRKLFELPVPVEESKEDTQQGIGAGRIAVGMETWQVKEVLGIPEKRNVVLATKNVRKEEWTYDNKHLYFTNGVLTSLEER